MKRYISIILGLLLLTQGMSAYALTPNDPFFFEQWYLDQIQAPDAWDVETGSSDVLVAILDTGIDLNHEDIRGQIFRNYNEIPNDGIDNDRNGLIDDFSGWDFFDDDQDPNPVEGANEEFGVHHGTVVAGVIGASGNNSLGVTGVNWDVKLLPIRVLDSAGDGDIGDIVRGIDYAISMGADVINLSFVGTASIKTLDQALQRAYDNGVVVVAAMGNVTGSGSDLDQVPLYPACSSGTGNDNVVIGVVSTDQNDMRSIFSNYGKNCADISAPGESIYITQVDGYSGGWNGTSLAAPVVSGAAALMKAKYPNATPKEILTTMQLSVDPTHGLAPSGVAGALGSGRLNLNRAMEMLPIIVSDKSSREPELIVEAVPLDDVQVEQLSPPRRLFTPITVGAGAGDEPLVTVFDYNGQRASFYAYARAFHGGVSVATGQLDSDAGYEIVTGAGKGGGPHIRVFNDIGALKAQFFAFDAGFSGGVDVAIGDVTGDGIGEILVASGEGRDPVVRVFDISGNLLNEIIVDDTGSAVLVSSGDVDGDGVDEIVVTRGAGGSPTVNVYKYGGQSIGSFLAYGKNMFKGVRSTVMPSSGRANIVVGTEGGAGPHVRSFDKIGALIGQYFAFSESNRDGVDVVAWEPYADGQWFTVTSGMHNGSPVLRVYDRFGSQNSVILDLVGYTERVNI